MKKGFLSVLFIFLCFALTSCGITWEETSSVQTSTIESISSGEEETSSCVLEPQNASLTGSSEVINVVIFICFADEQPASIRSTIGDTVVQSLNGENNSLQDYYLSLSYQKFNLLSIFPYSDEDIFYIYQDSHNRSYYTDNSNKSGSGRTRPESTLLNNAVLGANGYFSYGGLDLDSNDDGYVDSVTFLISGGYNDPTDWGKIMWPHSWQLDDITKSLNDSASASALNGITVNDYTFLFMDSFSKVGLICHEFGHAVGDLPDLYHYKYDTSYLSVGYWDLMHLDCKTPQYMTTYIRWKYLHFVEDSQIVELKRGGTYTLSPTTVTGEDSVLAYKIPISTYESIWIEYRRNDVSTYDSDLPGSGLIVYRVNTEATKGNQQAKQNNSRYPEELYVFRPSCAEGISGTTEKEKYNLSYAYISNNNPMFSSLGSADITEKYNSQCIYLSNGTNTKIALSVVYENKEEVSFSISLGDYETGEIAAAYVEGTSLEGKTLTNKAEIYYGDKVNVRLFVRYKNRSTYDEVDNFLLEYENKVGESMRAYAVYTDEYGTKKYPFYLTVRDKVTDVSILSLPTKIEYEVGDAFSLDGLVLSVSCLSGAEETISYTETNASLWQASGYTLSKSGRYTVNVVYRQTVTCSFTVTVLSEIAEIVVLEKDTWHLNGTDKAVCFTVQALYRDGTTMILSPDEYTFTYDKTVFNVKTEAVITLNDTPNISCTSYVYNVQSVPTALKLISYPKSDYTYGEALNLSDSTVTVVFGNNDMSINLPLENFYGDIARNFDATAVGNHLINLVLGNAVLNLSFTVNNPYDVLLSSSCDDATLIDDTVLLTADMTLADLASVLHSYSYLTVAFYRGECLQTVDINGSTYISSDITIKILNEDDKTVQTYSVIRLGDGNGDGLVNLSDVSSWENAVLSGTYSRLFDLDQNGEFTLTEFVLLLQLISEVKE